MFIPTVIHMQSLNLHANLAKLSISQCKGKLLILNICKNLHTWRRLAHTTKKLHNTTAFSNLANMKEGTYLWNLFLNLVDVYNFVEFDWLISPSLFLIRSVISRKKIRHCFSRRCAVTLTSGQLLAAAQTFICYTIYQSTILTLEQDLKFVRSKQ